MKAVIDEVTRELWTREWTSYEGARMTKIFFPQPREDILTELLRLERDTLGYVRQNKARTNKCVM